MITRSSQDRLDVYLKKSKKMNSIYLIISEFIISFIILCVIKSYLN
jgi:hypothetical protein